MDTNELLDELKKFNEHELFYKDYYNAKQGENFQEYLGNLDKEYIKEQFLIVPEIEGGFMPDCGAFCAAITLSTGVEPKYLGKPFKETVDMVLLRTGEERDRVAFVGDRLYTDVATGVNHGAHGFLVLSGETKPEDLDKSEVKPDAVYQSLGEMKELLENVMDY